jgi:adenosylmethionine-8-amino-7-oxononanoate aminotransferase
MTGAEASTLVERDRRCVWHPFTQRGMGGEPLPVVSALGSTLRLEEGREVLDGISSWWCNTLGHGHPELLKAAREQMERLDHVMFASFTHEPAVALAEELIEAAPPGYGKVFFSDNGSTACEVAIKMAVQLFSNRGARHRTWVVALEDSYHGDTFGAMAAGERGVFSAPFDEMLFRVERVPAQGGAAGQERMREICSRGDVAAFIFEPLVQGAGGMKMHSVQALDGYLSIAREFGVVTIADEVMTGFGRLGPLFASSLLKHGPEILCLSKGLTGGTMPLAVTLVRDALFDEFVSPDHSRTFFHGHTYTAHPVACAVARRALALTAQSSCAEERARIEQRHRAFAQELQREGELSDVRVCGTILAFNRKSRSGSGYLSSAAKGVTQFFLERGVLLRPLGDVLYVLPPYCTSDGELEKIYGTIREFVRATTR